MIGPGRNVIIFLNQTPLRLLSLPTSLLPPSYLLSFLSSFLFFYLLYSQSKFLFLVPILYIFFTHSRSIFASHSLSFSSISSFLLFSAFIPTSLSSSFPSHSISIFVPATIHSPSFLHYLFFFLFPIHYFPSFPLTLSSLSSAFPLHRHFNPFFYSLFLLNSISASVLIPTLLSFLFHSHSVSTHSFSSLILTPSLSFSFPIFSLFLPPNHPFFSLFQST